MSSTTQKFWEEQEYFENKEIEQETVSKDVQTIIDLFRLLEPSERVQVKKLLKSESIF